MKRLWTATLLVSTFASYATAQFGGGGGGGALGGGGGFGGGGGGGGGGGLGGGGMGGQGGGQGGVYLDPAGVVRTLVNKRPSTDWVSIPLPQVLKARADLRRISLKAVAAELDRWRAARPNDPFPEELQRLAGLFRIEFVVFDAAQDDVILYGPAEEWKYAPDGRPMGSTSKRPAIQLQDLATALRAVLNDDAVIRCTIEPTTEGLARFRAYQAPATDGSADSMNRLRQSASRVVGLQRVATAGVPKDSRFALAMVEADYQMKRLALGVDQASGLHTTLADSAKSKTEINRRDYYRWWFTAEPAGVSVNETGDAYRFVGPRMKLNAEKMSVMEDGSLEGQGMSEDAFAKSFNAHLGKLEGRFASLADLHNLFDVALTAGLIKKKGAPEWLTKSVLLDARLPTPRFQAPTQAEPIVHTAAGNAGMMIATGGVELKPMEIVQELRKGSSTGATVAPPKEENGSASVGAGWWANSTAAPAR